MLCTYQSLEKKCRFLAQNQVILYVSKRPPLPPEGKPVLTEVRAITFSLSLSFRFNPPCKGSLFMDREEKRRKRKRRRFLVPTQSGKGGEKGKKRREL